MNFIFKSCLLVALVIFTFAAASRAAAQSAASPVTNQPSVQTAPPVSVPTMSTAPAPAPKPSSSYNAENLQQRRLLSGFIVLLFAIGLVYTICRMKLRYRPSNQSASISPATDVVSPSPKGRGRGEGERDNRNIKT